MTNLMEFSAKQSEFWDRSFLFYRLCGVSEAKAEENAWLDLEDEFPETSKVN